MFLHFLLPETSVGVCQYGPLRCRRVHSSVLGLAPRGVQGMYGHFTAVAQLLSARGADPTCAESILSGFLHVLLPKTSVGACRYGPLRCRRVHLSVLGLAPRGV